MVITRRVSFSAARVFLAARQGLSTSVAVQRLYQRLSVVLQRAHTRAILSRRSVCLELCAVGDTHVMWHALACPLS